MGLNKVILHGNLTRDVELRYTPKGVAVAKVSVAVNRKYKTENGEEREEVTFVECDAFGRTAEVMGQYLKKGDPILIEGRLKLDQWEDKESGQKRQKLHVIIESFNFLNRSERPEGGGERSERPERPAQPKREKVAELPGLTDEEAKAVEEEDDIPF